jgi:hypothetical protein
MPTSGQNDLSPTGMSHFIMNASGTENQKLNFESGFCFVLEKPKTEF